MLSKKSKRNQVVCRKERGHRDIEYKSIHIESIVREVILVNVEESKHIHFADDLNISNTFGILLWCMSSSDLKSQHQRYPYTYIQYSDN